MALLDIQKSQKLLEKHGIKFAKSRTAKTEKELIKEIKKFKFPVAMKIISSKISHKTEAGGIKLNISNEAEALKAFNELKKLKGFQGTLIQEMLKGMEIIIGGKQDPQFGATILFGLGGIYVETLKDISLRICPITKTDAKEMIQEIKSYPLIKGTRGQKGINQKIIEKYLMQVSKLMMKEKIKELDINPLIGNEKEIKAIDARIIK